jgi:hypothetical protein
LPHNEYIFCGKRGRDDANQVSASMPIHRLLETSAFDPDTTKRLVLAFDAAWDVLRNSASTLAENDRSETTRKLLAEQIIAIGRTGERNQECLVKAALVHVVRREMISHGIGRSQASRARHKPTRS